MNVDQQASGAPAQNNYGDGAPPPQASPNHPQGQGRNWNHFYDVMMERTARQDDAILQVGGRLGLLEDIQRQAEAGESI